MGPDVSFLENITFNMIYIFKILDRWTTIPGGPLIYGSYNNSATFTSEGEHTDNKGFVLMSTNFKNKANITAIEFVPMNSGKLIIEVDGNKQLLAISTNPLKYFNIHCVF